MPYFQITISSCSVNECFGAIPLFKYKSELSFRSVVGSECLYCHGFGETEKESIKNAKDCLRQIIETEIASA